MPKFVFNKLVRDKFREEYARVNQIALFRELTKNEHAEALQQKIIEETNELPLTGTSDEIASEIADIQQVIDDLAVHYDISSEQIKAIKDKKFDKKGGFSKATFVETLELNENDEWVEYYRNSPDIFHEIHGDKSSTDELYVPQLERGIYQHYKGNRYEVIGLARHTETSEWFVVYKPLYEHDGQLDIWIRPYEIFIETVTVGEKVIPRFSKQDTAES